MVLQSQARVRAENRSGNFLDDLCLMPDCLPADAMPETNFRRSIPRCINRLPQALSQDQITFLEYLKLILHEDRAGVTQ